MRQGLGTGDATARRPGPTIHTAITRVQEIIQGHEIIREVMEVWCDGFAEERQRRIAVGTIIQVAQDLIEGAVLFHDVDHVLDLMMQEFHHWIFAGITRLVEVI